MSDGFAKLSRSDQLKIGRERLLRCLALSGGEYESVRHLDVQNKYLDEYNVQLSKSELRKLFNKGKMQEVLQEYLAEDVEIAVDPEQHGVLFLKLKRSLKEALAHQPKIAPNLVPASKEVVTTAKIVPVHRSIGNFVDEVPRKAADENDDGMDEDIFGPTGKGKETQPLDKQKLMADLGLVEQKKKQQGTKGVERTSQPPTEEAVEHKAAMAPRNFTTKKEMPKKKAPHHIAFFSDESDNEAEEEKEKEAEEKPNGGKGAERGQGPDKTHIQPQQQQKAKAPKNVVVISHAEKYIMRVKQSREEQAKQQQPTTEEGDAEKRATKAQQKSDSSEEEDDANEWDKPSEKSANGQHTNGNRKMTKYDAYLYAAVISTFMHVHKSTTLSKLHNYLAENYSDGHLFRSTFPDQAELLEFVRTNCKNIRCSTVSSKDFALLWSQDSEQKMVRLLLKVGKVLNEVAYAD